MRRILIGALSVALCFSVMPAQSQGVKDKVVAGVPLSLSVETPFMPSSIGAGKVPLGYQGHSAVRVFKALEGLAELRKGEFETTPEFEVRKAARFAQKYMSNLGVGDLLAFVVDVKKTGQDDKFFTGLGYRYNADNAVVDFFAEPKRYAPNGIGGSAISNRGAHEVSPALSVFTLDRKITDENEYTGMNGFGAKFQVSGYTSTTIDVGSAEAQFLRGRGAALASAQAAASLRMTPQMAAGELPVLKALLVVLPREPFASYHWDRSKPTLEYPRDIVLKSSIIRGDLVNVVFFSGLSGEIFAELSNPVRVDSGTAGATSAPNVTYIRRGCMVSLDVKPPLSAETLERVDACVRQQVERLSKPPINTLN